VSGLETKKEKFDLIVIGSGPAGYLATILGARKGLSVAIVEKAELGGTCLNRGCIPTKALLREAALWENFMAAKWGKEREKASQAFQSAMERKSGAVNQVVSGLRSLLGQKGITVIEGEASFVALRRLSVKRKGSSDTTIESDRILIATGAVASEIPGLKRDGKWVMTTDDVLKMDSLPSEITIVGGGKRGIEYACFFRAFGTNVTLIEKGDRILPKMDREISVRYKGILTKKGIKVLTGAEAVESSLTGKEGFVTLRILQKGKEERLQSPKVLLAGPRHGNLAGLGLEEAAISSRDGFVTVDHRMKTSVSGVYAAGDVTGRGFMAHKAFYEARVALTNLRGGSAEVDPRLIPICVYSQPEAASIGLTEEEARQKHGELKVGKFPFMGCGRAVAEGETEGMVKILSEPKYGEILGVHILGAGATEMIHFGMMAMKAEMGIEELKEMLFAHPTLSEAFYEAALDTDNEAIHIVKA